MNKANVVHANRIGTGWRLVDDKTNSSCIFESFSLVCILYDFGHSVTPPLPLPQTGNDRGNDPKTCALYYKHLLSSSLVTICVFSHPGVMAESDGVGENCTI